MKKTLMKFGVRKWVKVFLLVSVCIAAQQLNATPSVMAFVKPLSGTSKLVSVTIAGTTESEILVDIKIANANAEKLILVIENERGDELYKKEIDKIDFVTRFRLQKADNISNYSVLIKSANHSLKEKYFIKTATKTIEDVTVTKL
jgi:hypothetical protein